MFLKVINFIIDNVVNPITQAQATLYIVQRRKNPRTPRELMASMYKIG